MRNADSFDIPYVRDPNGDFQSVNFPNFGGGNGEAINIFGAMVGNFLKLNEVQGAVFHYHTSCTNTPNPPADCAGEGTFPGNVNILGRVVGTYDGEDGNPHAFWRDSDGSFTKFDAPGANYFTQPIALNDRGQITGLVYDPNIVVHGLLVNP